GARHRRRWRAPHYLGYGYGSRLLPRSLAWARRETRRPPVTRRQRIEDLTAFAVPEQPAMSPGGTQIVYVLRTQDAEADSAVRSLWRVDTGGGEPERLTRGTADVAPAWSPDGRQVAFLRATDGPAQVWLLPIGGGEPEQLTTLPLGAGA